MHRLGRFLLKLLFFATLVLANPVTLPGITTSAHDSSVFEQFGPKSSLLSQQAQERLNQLEDALNAAREKRDTGGEAQALRLIGLLNYSNQRYDDALDACSSSLALYRKLNAERPEATELSELASAYVALGMYQKALDAYKEALPIWRRLDHETEAATLGKIAEIFRMLHDAQGALHFDYAALEAYMQTGDRGGQATVLNNIGLAYFALGKTRKAADYFHKARAAYHDMLNLAGEATVLNNLAVVYSASGDNVEALASFERELELTRKIKDRNAEAATLNGIAVTYSRMGESMIAHGFYDQAASVYHELGDQQSESRELAALSLAVTDAKRKGHKKNAETDEVLNRCPAQLTIVH